MWWREMREGVQEYECVCIFKAVFLLQEEGEKNSSPTGKRMSRATDEGMQMQFSDGNWRLKASRADGGSCEGNVFNFTSR